MTKQQAAMKIHFENNEPFLVVSQLERNIEVSHWGNIAVWEDIRVSHNGAKLKGSFSRYDYQRQQNSGLSSVKSFKTNLPASAVDVYYRCVRFLIFKVCFAVANMFEMFLMFIEF